LLIKIVVWFIEGFSWFLLLEVEASMIEAEVVDLEKLY
jgi:hypothetical protein